MTRMLNVQEFEFPEPSIAVQVTVFVPTGKMDPFVGELTNVSAPSQMSDATGAGNVTAAPPESRGASATIISAGQEIVGGVVSTTLTVWLQKALLLHASVAFHVRVAVNVPPAITFVIVPEIVMVTLVP